MKITIKKEVEKTVKKTIDQEFEVPAYIEHGHGVHLIQNESDYIEVSEYSSQDGSLVHHMIDLRKGYDSSVALVLSGGRPVDKACFQNAWQRAVEAVNKMDREMKGWDEIHQEHIWEQSHELTDDNKDGRRDEEMIEKFGHEAKEFEL